jgi:acyl-CoA-binding protein
MPEGFIPIDYSNLKDVIPPGEDILYSTLCVAETVSGINTPLVKDYKKHTWKTHVLLTENGIAFTYPRDINYKKKELKNNPNLQDNHFIPWENTLGIAKVKKRGRISLCDIKGKINYSPWLYLVNFTDKESKKQYIERMDNLINSFAPIQSLKREKLEEELFNILVDNPEFLKANVFYEIEEHKRFDYAMFNMMIWLRKKEIKKASKAKN